jgi:nucleoid-associated protein YgaU
LLISISAFFIFTCALFSQDDDEGMTQQEWEAIRDSAAVNAIKKLARIDTLNIEIDSLKKLLDYSVNLDCEAELYKTVGATKEQVNDFRKKFEITEDKVNSNTGTPDEARVMYFNELSSSKIICLPEFSERFIALKKKLDSWEVPEVIIEKKGIDTLYTVVENDYLKRIAIEVYGDPDMWTIIWEANRESVYNANELKEKYKKKIKNPHRIYPGQILRIPKQK